MKKTLKIMSVICIILIGLGIFIGLRYKNIDCNQMEEYGMNLSFIDQKICLQKSD